MWRFTTYTGTVIEVQRYINKPMRWHERPVCHERRELWVSNGTGDQRKWVIHSKLMPARRDHQVTLLLVGPWVIGLFNSTAHTGANYVREDPPFLLRGADALVVLALMATACALLPLRRKASVTPRAAETEVPACPAPKTSYSLSDRRRKPLGPSASFTCQRPSRRPVRAL